MEAPFDPKKNELGKVSRAALELSGKNANPKVMRTFQSDIAERIQSGEASLVKIAMAEHARNEGEKTEKDPTSIKNLLLIIGGIVLVLIGIAFIVWGLLTTTPKTVNLSTTEGGAVQELIRSEAEQGLNITGFSRDGIKDALLQTYTTLKPKLGDFIHVVPFTTDGKNPHVLETKDFFTGIESAVPGALIRSFNPLYTIIVHGWSTDGMAFIFKTDSYENAFTQMLAWEPDMFDELYRMFGIDVSGENSSIFSTRFKDKVIKNQDTRALVNAKGIPVFFYTFLGEQKNLLVITNSESTLEEIVRRLTASTLKR